MVGMTSIVRNAIDRYESRMTNARKAAATDPQYAYQRSVLHHMLEIADMAMEDEGIPEESRRRVIATMLYGSPHEADALLRAGQQEQIQRMLMDTKPTITFPLGEPKF